VMLEKEERGRPMPLIFVGMVKKVETSFFTCPVEFMLIFYVRDLVYY